MTQLDKEKKGMKHLKYSKSSTETFPAGTFRVNVREHKCT